MIKKTLAFLAFAVALPALILLAIFQLQAGLLAVCLYAFVLLMLICWLMTVFWLHPLQCEREISDEVVEIGDSVKVIVKLKNRSLWPVLWLYAEETLPEKMPIEGTTKRLLFLPPGRSFYLHYVLTITKRGCHRIGPLVLETGDVFGLFKRCRVEQRLDYVTALPAYQIIEEFQVGQRRRLADIAAAHSIFDDPSRIRGIREYRRGDSMNRIHWKSTARTGVLHTKIYEPVVEAAATVVLDFHEDSWSGTLPTDPDKPPHEMAIEVACTVCRYLTDGGWKVGFFSNGRDPLGLPGLSLAQAGATGTLSEAVAMARSRRADSRLEPISIRARTSPDQFLIIRENLGRIELSNGLRIETLLMGELPYIEREQALVILTGDVTDSFINGVLRARELGYRIMLFILCNPKAHDRAFDAFLPHGIEVYRMDEQWRLKEIATGRRAF